MDISVFITSYNQKKWLVEAIESVLAQTRPAAQIIVADDGSTDGSREVIESFASRHPGLFTVILHEQNMGVAQTRIDALECVTSDYVTYVDGDDRLLPNKLELEASALDKSASAGIAFSNNRYMSADMSEQVWTWVEKETVPQGDIFIETFGRLFPRRSLFRMELVRYPAWREIGFHDPKLALYEDFDMRIRLTKHLKAIYVDELTAEIRHHGTGLSQTPLKKHVDALDYIRKKNDALLADLSSIDRARIIAGWDDWVEPVRRRLVKQSIASGNVMQALLAINLRSLIFSGKS